MVLTFPYVPGLLLGCWQLATLLLSVRQSCPLSRPAVRGESAARRLTVVLPSPGVPLPR